MAQLMRSGLSTSRLAAAAVCAVAVAVAILLGAGSTSASAKVPGDFYGVFAEGPSEQDFSAMGKAGFGSYRVPVNWKAIQRTKKGGYQFSQSDYGMVHAAENGMSPVFVVFGTPRFVHKSTSRGLHGPTSKSDLKQWKRFTKALAERYSPGGGFFDSHPDLDAFPVRTWILWNEQNSKNNWLPRTDPRAYGKLVIRGEEGISSVDPGAEIVLGGMFGYPRDSKSMKAKKFLGKLYKVKGIKKHFDAINSHPYGKGVGDVKRQINALRTVARHHGDRRVGLFVGEFGWASKGPKKSESVVGKKGQAKRLQSSLRLFAKKRRKWNIGGAFVYTWRDFAANQIACNWCPWAGLTNRKGKPKPALGAVKKILRKQG
jgi:hypothetical protein